LQTEAFGGRGSTNQSHIPDPLHVPLSSAGREWDWQGQRRQGPMRTPCGPMRPHTNQYPMAIPMALTPCMPMPMPTPCPPHAHMGA
jgi:hypothetical protein